MKLEVKWLVGGENFDTGVFSLPDGTLIAKECESNGIQCSYKRTFRILKKGEQSLPHVEGGRLTAAFCKDLHQVIEDLKNR